MAGGGPVAWGGPALLSNLPQRALWEAPGWGWCIWPGPALQTDGDVLNAVAAHPERLTYCQTNSDVCWGP